MFDVALLLIIVMTTMLGGYWGTIRQILALAGLLAGLALGVVYGGGVAAALSSYSADTALIRGSGVVLVALPISAAVSLAASLLQRRAGWPRGGWADRVFGGVLGFLQGVVFCAALAIIGAAFASPLWYAVLHGSRVAPLLVLIGSNLIGWLFPGSWIQAATLFFSSRS